MNLFDKAIFLTDVHFGLRNNDKTHNLDCLDFIDWVIDTARKRNITKCFFLGDWHDSRHTIHVSTLNYSNEGLCKLNNAFEKTYFILGNHDLFYKENRKLFSVPFVDNMTNIELIKDPKFDKNVLMVPWLIGDEWTNVVETSVNAHYVFGHFELPNFMLNDGIVHQDHGGLTANHLKHVKGGIFSGHFHHRQTQNNVTYMGNAFPNTFADTWDDNRGVMILEWGQTPEYINWKDAPKFRSLDLSELLEAPHAFMVPKSYMKVNVDIDISYDEQQFIKNVLTSRFDVRKLQLDCTKNDVQQESQVDPGAFQTTDQIVMACLENLDSNSLQPELLIEIYQELETNSSDKHSGQLILESLYLKNIMRVGNCQQEVNLNNQKLNLILGENLDVNGTENRNGVGKTTILQALSFVLFDKPLTKISKDNLINKVNKKELIVGVNLSKGNKTYTIERGRKPNYLKFFVNGEEFKEKGNDAQGDNRQTLKEINKIIGMSYELFKHIVVLHNKTVPFLSLGNPDQSKLIEELLGIQLLREKSELLKEVTKSTKDEMKGEEIRLRTIKDSNEKVQKAINELRTKSNMWERDQKVKITDMKKKISDMNSIDIQSEIDNHTLLDDWKSLFDTTSNEVKILTREQHKIKSSINEIDSDFVKIEKDLSKAANHECPLCGQEVHDGRMDDILQGLEAKVSNMLSKKEDYEVELDAIEKELALKKEILSEIGPKPKTFYDSVKKAYEHRSTLDSLNTKLGHLEEQNNPYIDQIASLSDVGLHDIDDEYLSTLNTLLNHQDYLYKLLTNNNSFIRQKIIDQNLPHLNIRLNQYLNKLGLQYKVTFNSDLTVDITELGLEYDFEQMSGGEGNRLILALSWAFRDIWEMINDPINFSAIDELIDSGMDGAGVDLALEVLRGFRREKNKSIFLISHKDDLLNKVDHVLLVQRESGFTNIIDGSYD